MRRRAGYQNLALPRLSGWVRLLASMVVLCSLAACGSRTSYHASTRYRPSRYYPPPGPSSDPWGPYIHEAAGRFSVPERWIRRVMRQESGGQEDVISWAGAMGLMQVMPETYDGLRWRYSLGEDPYDPHNNILAGTAYLREMYDRFGAPGFLAAYNAGPNRLDRYLNNGTPLPEETVNYVASIAPLLGADTPMSGPLAGYAMSGGFATQLTSRQTPAGCDPDAAYDPSRPCVPIRQQAMQPTFYANAAAASSRGTVGCDPDAAFDPNRPCTPVPPAAAQTVAAASFPPALPYAPSTGGCDPNTAFDPTRPCRPMTPAPIQSATIQPAPTGPAPAVLSPIVVTALPQPAPSGRISQPIGASRPLQETTAKRVAFQPANPVTPPPTSPMGAWGIQVGAFANLSTAQVAAENARLVMPELLRTAKIELPATTPFGGKPAFRARLVGLSPAAAATACSRLNGRGLACVTVPPARETF